MRRIGLAVVLALGLVRFGSSWPTPLTISRTRLEIHGVMPPLRLHGT
jgi:hypothetical protein